MLMHPNLGLRLDALSWYEKAIDLSMRLGAPATGGHFGALSLEDYRNEKRREYLLDFLLEALVHLSGVAKHAGLEYLLWEPMPLLREPPATIQDATKLHERANKAASVPIQFCLDVGHQCTRGVEKADRDPYEWLRHIGAVCPCIHLQQTDGLSDHHWPFTREYNEKGIIHPEKVLEALEKASARDVMFLFEIIHPFEQDEDKVLNDIRESVNYWKTYVSV
jgi:sugar phosphate isomerase/epimerase